MADYALLVVSAGKGEFEAGFDRHAQTKEHMLFAYTMGLCKYVYNLSTPSLPPPSPRLVINL